MKTNYLSSLTSRLKANVGQWVLLWYKNEPYWGRLCSFDPAKKNVQFDHWVGVMQGVKTLSVEHISGMVCGNGDLALLSDTTVEQRYTIVWKDAKKVEASWTGTAVSEAAFVTAFRRATGLRSKPRGAVITTATSVPEQKGADELVWQTAGLGQQATCRWGAFIIVEGVKGPVLTIRRRGEVRGLDQACVSVDEAKALANKTMKAWREG